MSEQVSAKKLFLIDGSGYAYRAFYAIKSLSNSKGQPTNAVYGFVRMLLKIMTEYRPDYLAVCFDLAAPTFRHKEFKEYKAHRKPTPQELIVQLPVIRDIIDAYRIRIVEREGFEADDLIATLARKGEKEGLEVIILSGDKDMMQIVNDRIRMISTGKEEFVYGPQAVHEKFGVRPDQIVDLLCLTGDASDNIPGVPGVGVKTAAALIEQFGTIEKLYQNLDQVKGEKLRKNLEEYTDTVFSNRGLVVVKDDLDIDFGFQELVPREPDRNRLITLFKEMEFTGLLKDILVHEEAPGTSYHCIATADAYEGFLRTLRGVKGFVIDTETTNIDPMRADLVGVAFGWSEEDAYYVALGGKIPVRRFIDDLKPILEDPKIEKYGQNVKYDKVVFLNYGVDMRGVSFDTMVAHYLLNPSKLRHNLGELAMEYLNYKMTSIRELIGEGKREISMKEVPLADISKYACEDAVVTLRLKKIFEPQLHEKGLNALFHDMEIPLIDVLAAMEYTGVAVDEELLRDMGKEFQSRLEQITGRIYALAGEEFNINSPKALGVILFEKLKLPVKRKTKTGYSTDADVLTALAKIHELPREVVNYRQLAKLKSTYIDVLPHLINPKTGRIHTSFNQTVTATGRLSSSEPNLQNIPVKTELGRQIREAFIPRKDADAYLLLGADYSQIELRILAHLSQDHTLLHAFKHDMDIHSYTAGLVYGADPEAVTEDMRRKAKIVNFGIVYGMSPYGLAQDLGVSDAEAKAFIDEYFKRYPGVYEYIQNTIQKARHDKYVTTIFHRRRYIPEIASANFAIRSFSERTAINTPIQGSAADIIKLAMIALHKEILREGFASRMLLQIHDELIFEVPQREIDRFRPVVKRLMEGVVHLDVPIKVDINAGKSWAEI